MKCFIEGNRLCIANDDFVDLQESVVLFIPISERDRLRYAKFERVI